MAYAFGKLGIRHVLIDSVGGMAGEVASFAEKEDAIFAISFTPYASETIALAAQAADRGVPIVAATDSPFSPLAQRAGIWFEVVEADVEGFRSLSASFALVTTLTVAVAERRRDLPASPP
jgi:DNA-binding MurR/RpiR family transcriptional regulator